MELTHAFLMTTYTFILNCYCWALKQKRRQCRATQKIKVTLFCRNNKSRLRAFSFHQNIIKISNVQSEFIEYFSVLSEMLFTKKDHFQSSYTKSASLYLARSQLEPIVFQRGAFFTWKFVSHKKRKGILNSGTGLL